MYTAIVAVWRLDNTSNQYSQYSVVNGSVTLIQLRPVNTLARIYCTQVLLDPVNYTEIRQGDVVGVTFPSQYPIPMIGMTSDHTIMEDSTRGSFLADIKVDDLSTQSLSIHLYISKFQIIVSDSICSKYAGIYRTCTPGFVDIVPGP